MSPNIPPDNRAILSVNLLKNGIGVEQARALVIILKEHPTLKSLCGNSGDETELDMSVKMRGAGDAIMLAAEIVDNGALSILDASNTASASQPGSLGGQTYRSPNLTEIAVCADKHVLKHNAHFFWRTRKSSAPCTHDSIKLRWRSEKST
jgi:hypothetical protein